MTSRSIPFSEKRYLEMLDEFEAILLGEPCEAWADREAALLPVIARAFPAAPPLMHRAALRLTIGFVSTMPDLLIATVPGHLNMLRNYAWGRASTPDEREGHGSFWLFRASNTVLEGYESQIMPILQPFFHVNAYRPMAVRAWIRLQTRYMEPREAMRLIEIRESHSLDGMDAFSVPARQFVDSGALPRFEDAQDDISAANAGIKNQIEIAAADNPMAETA